VSRQPDFSTAPRPGRVPQWGTFAVGAGLLAAILAAAGSWRARDQARAAEARVADLRREVTAASARVRDLEVRARGARLGLSATDVPPARVVAEIASVLPGDARLERLSIDYARDGALEMSVVARDASAWDRLIEGLARAPGLRDVEPGPEAREAEVRSIVKARWAGGAP
jgi:Tfp pilus assembly protein PilN